MFESPTPTPVTPSAPTPPQTPSEAPKYVTLPFTVEAYSDYVFPIYLGNDQTLHLSWRVTEGSKVWFHIVTPSGALLGFCNNGQFANDTLTEDRCEGFMEGRTTLSPSQYSWGEGHYEMIVSSHYSDPSELEMRYWIEGEPVAEEAIEDEATDREINEDELMTEE